MTRHSLRTMLRMKIESLDTQLFADDRMATLTILIATARRDFGFDTALWMAWFNSIPGDPPEWSSVGIQEQQLILARWASTAREEGIAVWCISRQELKHMVARGLAWTLIFRIILERMPPVHRTGYGLAYIVMHHCVADFPTLDRIFQWHRLCVLRPGQFSSYGIDDYHTHQQLRGQLKLKSEES